MRFLQVGVIQMSAGADKSRNLKHALRLVRRAAQKGAQFILLPEVFNQRGAEGHAKTPEKIPGPSLKPFMVFAKQKKLWILAGSILERSHHRSKNYNTSVLIGPDGKVRARYRKRHLFNVSYQGLNVRESDTCLRGQRPVMSQVDGVQLGLSICYDLRFPELFYHYAKMGAKILCVPSNFTQKTGRAHWELLLRARAIETQCFVLAPNQHGVGKNKVRSYGNSLVVDPWGKVLARGKTSGDAVLITRLDLKVLDRIRRSLPSLRESLL